MLGRTYNQIPLVLKAREMGFRAITAGSGGGEPVADRAADDSYDIDASDRDAMMRLARTENTIGLATCGTSTAMCTVAYVTEQLGLSDKVISYATAVNAVHKDNFRRLIPDLVPRGRIACTADETIAAGAALQAPIAVKPGDGGGGKGITVLESLDTCAIRRAFLRAQNAGRSGRVIVEEFLTGPVLGVESIVLAGEIHVLAIADKIVTRPPRGVTLGVAFPSQLPPDTQSAIRHINADAIRRLGIFWGPTHIDMVLDASYMPHIIDIGPRLAGGEIMARLVPDCYGYDAYGAALSLSVGSIPPVPGQPNGRFYGERFLTAPHVGRLVSITYDQKEMESFGIMSCRQLIANGGLLYTCDDSGCRVIMFTSSAPTYGELMARLDGFAECVHITIEQ